MFCYQKRIFHTFQEPILTKHLVEFNNDKHGKKSDEILYVLNPQNMKKIKLFHFNAISKHILWLMK